MELSYKQLEATLVRHFHIHPERVATFRSRIKQLQRLGFPEGVNIGHGQKMAYTAEHLFQLVTALELMSGADMTADRAKKIVFRHWPEFRYGYGLVSASTGPYANEVIYARLIIRSFGNLQIEDIQELNTEGATKVIIEDRGHFFSIFDKYVERRSHCYPVLCASDIFHRLIGAACDAGGVIKAAEDAEFIEWQAPTIEPRHWLRLTSLEAKMQMLEKEREYLEMLNPERSAREMAWLASETIPELSRGLTRLLASRKPDDGLFDGARNSLQVEAIGENILEVVPAEDEDTDQPPQYRLSAFGRVVREQIWIAEAEKKAHPETVEDGLKSLPLVGAANDQDDGESAPEPEQIDRRGTHGNGK